MRLGLNKQFTFDVGSLSINHSNILTLDIFSYSRVEKYSIKQNTVTQIKENISEHPNEIYNLKRTPILIACYIFKLRGNIKLSKFS